MVFGFKGAELNPKELVASCRGVRLSIVPTIAAGERSCFKGTRDISFEINRVYYIL